MALSAIVLEDPRWVRLDHGARSLAYFCLKSPVRVDKELLEQLKGIAVGLEGRNLRLCLHDSPGATFHEMIILEKRDKYYRPHKHLAKGESYHLIEGSLAAFVFDTRGGVVDACLLEAQGTFLYRVGANMFHSVMPLTDLVVYHESKPGPFEGESDSIYPDWAPDGSDGEEVARYRERLLRALGMEKTRG